MFRSGCARYKLCVSFENKTRRFWDRYERSAPMRTIDFRLAMRAQSIFSKGKIYGVRLPPRSTRSRLMLGSVHCGFAWSGVLRSHFG